MTRSYDYDAFGLVEVTNSSMMGLQAIGIGSKKERRERACSVALAIAATRDPRFVSEITGSLKIVADGCQIIEMNGEGRTRPLHGIYTAFTRTLHGLYTAFTRTKNPNIKGKHNNFQI